MSDVYRRAKQLFLEAVAKPEDERDAFLEQACAGDDRLLARVRELIAADREDDSLLDAQATELLPLEAESPFRDGSVIGKQLLHFEITALLGSGGMGEVYRATDTRLGREVAIKVLQSTGDDPERVARFEREARTLASLHHPYIAGVHGFEHDQGEHFLVMEFVDGEDLQSILKRGRPRVETAVSIACQIAEGLEAAHERGIVHRDLKPANVIVSGDGTAKILDFGLARPFAKPEGQVSLDDSLTQPTGLTQKGTILGTAAYMSPEQARGKVLDKRTDIWSFGVILLELLTGEQPFRGDSFADSIAKVLQAPIDLGELPVDMPPAQRSLVARCLERNPRQRLRDIGEARVTLAAPIAEHSTGQPTGRPTGRSTNASRVPSRRLALAWVPAILIVALLSFFAARWSIPPATPAKAGSVRFEVPSTSQLGPLFFALDHRGERLVYVDGRQLFIRQLDDLTPLPIPGTDDATHCVWSPDDAWIAYHAEAALYKIRPDGSDRFLLAELESALQNHRSLTWLDNGDVLFEWAGALWSVSAQGGPPREVVAASDEGVPTTVTEAPGGRGLILSRYRGLDNPLTFELLDGEERIEIVRPRQGTRTRAAVYSAGHLLYTAHLKNEGLWAQPFSLDDRASSGDPFVLVPDVYRVAGTGEHLAYTLSDRDRTHDLQVVDRSGRVLRTPIQQQTGLSSMISISPDRTQIAVTIDQLLESSDVNDFETGPRQDIWLFDAQGGPGRRLIFGKGKQESPAWRADGGAIAYSRMLDGVRRPIVRDLVRGTERVVAEVHANHLSFSADGNLLALCTFNGEDSQYDIGYVDLTTGALHTLVGTPAIELHPAVSPDGRYIAYQSDETGRAEIYVTDFPAGGSRWRVSEAGGKDPFWSASGDRLYFRQVGLFEVAVTTSPSPQFGAPRRLFSAGDIYWIGRGPSVDQFLVHRPSVEEEAQRSIIVWLNWATGSR